MPRSACSQLEASYLTYRAFVLANWESSVSFLASTVFSNLEVILLERLIDHYDEWLESERTYLGHGDFSSRHIFQEGGHYTGIIDFGDSQYESHIRFTSILITVSALAYTLQRHPPDRFTQHQLKTLRHDLTNI